MGILHFLCNANSVKYKVMKKIIISALFSLLFAGGIFAQKSGEGTFTVVSESAAMKEANASMECFLKDGNLLMKVHSEQLGGMLVNILMDSKTNSKYMLMDNGGKTAIKIKTPPMVAGATPVVTETNEKKVIDGYNCHKFIIKSDKNTSDVWVTSDVDFSFAEIFGALTKSTGISTVPAGLKGCPVLISSSDNNGAKTTLSLKNFKKTSVDSKMFDLTGYSITEMDLPAMMGDH